MDLGSVCKASLLTAKLEIKELPPWMRLSPLFHCRESMVWVGIRQNAWHFLIVCYCELRHMGVGSLQGQLQEDPGSLPTMSTSSASQTGAPFWKICPIQENSKVIWYGWAILFFFFKKTCSIWKSQWACWKKTLKLLNKVSLELLFLLMEAVWGDEMRGSGLFLFLNSFYYRLYIKFISLTLFKHMI